VSGSIAFKQSLVFGMSLNLFPALLAVFLLPIFFIPTLGNPISSSRLLLTIILGLPGLVWLIILAYKGPAKIQARSLLLYLLVTGVAIIGASDKLLSVFGTQNFQTGYIFSCLTGGLFALVARNLYTGINLTEWRLIKLCFCVGITINSLILIAQHVQTLNLLLPNVIEASTTEPSSALFGNPVYLAEFCTSAVSFLIITNKKLFSFYHIPVVLASISIALSVDRMAIILLIILLFFVAFIKHFRRSLFNFPYVVVGYLIGLYLGRAYAKGHLHFTQSSLNITQRLILWKHLLSLDATSFHLLTGYGPSQVYALLISHPSYQLVRNSFDSIFSSPHNILLEALTSGGIIALCSFLVFLTFCFIRAKNELFIYCLVSLVFHLIEPSTVTTNSLWFLLLGLMLLPKVDAPMVLQRNQIAKNTKVVINLSWVLGILISLIFLVGEFSFYQTNYEIAHYHKVGSRIAFSKLPFLSTRYLLGFWPVGDSTMANYWAYLAINQNSSFWKNDLSYRLQALNLQKENPTLCLNYARDLAKAGYFQKSMAQYQECVKIYPFNAEALLNLYDDYYLMHAPLKAAYYYQQLCKIFNPKCPPASKVNPNNIIKALNVAPYINS
jgi:hypothetical protein